MPALRAGYGRFRDWRRHAAPLRFDQIVLKSALICLHGQWGPRGDRKYDFMRQTQCLCGL